MDQAQLDLTANHKLSGSCLDRRLPPKHTRSSLLNKDEFIHNVRYEWFLYLRIPDRLHGQLLLSDVIKYRVFDADYVSTQRWKREKKTLVEATRQPKLMAEPSILIPKMANELSLRLHEG
ncbi:hypothetical protein [Reinekea sp. G2M2-21]|uniref:hypothetical protein n=1 Tax=Reinekea sp. G2M2-21 TaxID=2788942 RepID=UPI0018AC60A8|nr:hypothetical protein [Reinekea sp. G2M2-21]